MYHIHEGNYFSGISPYSIIGNQYLLIGFAEFNGSSIIFSSQIAFGHGSNKIAIRNAPYIGSTTSWTSWRSI